MKKIVSFLLIVPLLFSCIAYSAFATTTASPRYINVIYLFNDLHYVDGEFECFISIESPKGATTENVTITLGKVTDTQTVNIATWSGLSSNYRFTFLEYVSVANPNGTYRLTVTADIIYNGIVEHVEKTTEKVFNYSN